MTTDLQEFNKPECEAQLQRLCSKDLVGQISSMTNHVQQSDNRRIKIALLSTETG